MDTTDYYRDLNEECNALAETELSDVELEDAA